MPKYPRTSHIVVEPYTRQQEGNEIIIGRVETGLFVAVPPEAVDVLERLSEGDTVGEVSDHYQRQYGEIPDLEDFLSLMESKGIIQSCTAIENGDGSLVTSATKISKRRFHFANFPETLAQKIFSWQSLTGASILMATAAVALLFRPSLRPSARDLFFPDHRTLCVTLLTLISYFSIFLHELGHLVAARALGINSRLGLSNRLWYLVAETDLTGLWSVPKNQRYLPLVAGVLVDLVLASVLVLFLFFSGQSIVTLPIIAQRLVRALVVTCLLRIAWQFFFYIRTDFYYVIANFFGCKNLLGDTTGFIRNQLARIFRFIRPIDQSSIPSSEFRMIRFYAVIWAAGRGMALFLLVTVTVPVFVRYAHSLRSVFAAGYMAGRGNFVDGLLFSVYSMTPLVTGFSMWIIGLIRRERT
ncbi:MAG TPA: hypothetical protein VKZ53_16850 [Candidatus Angelobacter sp.]|nr:hypothetical protein [Candidatus Angelobacter sp.]